MKTSDKLLAEHEALCKSADAELRLSEKANAGALQNEADRHYSLALEFQARARAVSSKVSAAIVAEMTDAAKTSGLFERTN